MRVTDERPIFSRPLFVTWLEKAPFVLVKRNIVEGIALRSTRCSSASSIFHRGGIIVRRSVYPTLYEAEECVTLPAQSLFIWLGPLRGIVHDCQHGLGDIFRGTATDSLGEGINVESEPLRPQRTPGFFGIVHHCTPFFPPPDCSSSHRCRPSTGTMIRRGVTRIAGKSFRPHSS